MSRWFFAFLILALTAATATAQVGTQIPATQTVTVDAHGECRDVTNPGTGTRMVFTSTAPEWQSFIDNPNGLEMAACGPDCAKTWTLRTVPADTWWEEITYGNGLFVALGHETGSDRIITSPDGINWTVRAAPEINNWTGVTYGNGLFVAVAFGSSAHSVMTSPDGINWTARTAPVDDWMAVTYGNGMFVAVATGSGTIMTSPNGINWTKRTVPNGSGWWDVTYGGGQFVAVSEKGTNRVITSPNGINWTERTPPLGQWGSVTYGNGLFVAVAYSSADRIMTSPDGINWTVRTPPNSNRWQAVTYGGGQFVAVGNKGDADRIITSPDGINWTAHTAPEKNAWLGITYGNGMFVAGAASGTHRIMTSPCESGGADGGVCGSDGQGVRVGGFCWYRGETGQSCTDVCSERGGVNLEGTRDYAGSGGTDAACLNIMNSLGFPSYGNSVFTNCDSTGSGSACGCFQNSYASRLARCTSATTTATCSAFSEHRACACNADTPPPPADCTTPWGEAVAPGATVTAYQAASVPNGSNCVSQIRTCTVSSGGTRYLSGSYTNQNCTVEPSSPPTGCTTPWGEAVALGDSVTAYQAASVPNGSNCVSETRTCMNDLISGASLSGSYTHQNCTVEPPPSSGACETGPVGTVCSDGAIYAGELNGTRLYAAPADEGNTLPWNNGSTNWTWIGLTSTTDGLANTNALVSLSDAGAPYKAAEACRARGEGWYLPAIDELNVLYTNRIAIGGLNASSYYWSSTEFPDRNADILMFNGGFSYWQGKDVYTLTRCIRQ